jgi:chorismate mutase
MTARRGLRYMQAEGQVSVPEELLHLRNSIDAIDEELLAVLVRRFEVTGRVGQLKAEFGLDSVDPVREQQKLERLRRKAEDLGLNSAFISELFQKLFDEVVKNHRGYLKQAQR